MNLIFMIIFTIMIIMIVPINCGRIHSPKSLKYKKNPYDDREQRMHPNDDQLQQPLNIKKTLKQESRFYAEQLSDFWLDDAEQFVAKQLLKKQNKNIAKNIILFLGDGMSTTTLAATRPFIGGEETYLSFEEFPWTGMAKTYCVSNQVSDSASTATAYLSGVKANYGTVGVSAKVPRYHCTAQLDETTHTSSIAKWAMDAGKVAGLVSTCEVTDASPSGVYAHASNRYWVNDGEILSGGCDPNLVKDITKQLVLDEVGKNLRVIMGGGRSEFRDRSVVDEEGVNGHRTDGRDLIEEWKQLKQNERAKYIWNATELKDIDASQTDYLLALFEADKMKYHLEVEAANLTNVEPSLADMTIKAIEILSKNEEGYFLFIEGGRIDTAHHDTHARLALDETAELSKAVEAALKMINLDDTLVVVTSDHSHTMSYSGYPYRYNDITGLAMQSNEDFKPFMTLNYANGLGFYNNVNETGRINLRDIDTSSMYFRFPATLPINRETHGGDDVAVFATGPWSHLFTGNFEQHLIPHIMAYAACIGQGKKICD